MARENEFIDQTDAVNRFFSHFMRDQHKVYAFIMMMVHNQHDADDLMQETAIVLWEKFSDYDEGKSFTAWGIGIARNLIRRYREKQLRRDQRFADCTYQVLDEYSESCLEQFDDRMNALNHCIGKLNDTDQELVALRYEQKLSVKSIAERLSRSFKGLYQSFARIHGVLEDCINRHLTPQRLP